MRPRGVTGIFVWLSLLFCHGPRRKWGACCAVDTIVHRLPLVTAQTPSCFTGKLESVKNNMWFRNNLKTSSLVAVERNVLLSLTTLPMHSHSAELFLVVRRPKVAHPWYKGLVPAVLKEAVVKLLLLKPYLETRCLQTGCQFLMDYLHLGDWAGGCLWAPGALAQRAWFQPGFELDTALVCKQPLPRYRGCSPVDDLSMLSTTASFWTT